MVRQNNTPPHIKYAAAGGGLAASGPNKFKRTDGGIRDASIPS